VNKSVLWFYLLSFLLIGTFSYSQLKDDYRRSSLSITLIEIEDFPNREVILNSYNEYPFPETSTEVELSKMNLTSHKKNYQL
jgi:hypothetical protein